MLSCMYVLKSMLFVGVLKKFIFVDIFFARGGSWLNESLAQIFFEHSALYFSIVVLRPVRLC